MSQIDKFEHVIFSNTTNETIVKLSKKLNELTDNLGKVFYAGDGSSAIEIALKMSLHYRKIKNEHDKYKFISLNNSYHGETIGALSVSNIDVFSEQYNELLFDSFSIKPLYVNSISDEEWFNVSSYWEEIESKLTPYIKTTTAIIVEPILQAAGGMKIYSKDFLSKLANWAKKHDIHIIADEIMTGIGRTGEIFAYKYANITPDFLCLSKGLTSGWMAFSAVITTNEIHRTVTNKSVKDNCFMHSHTYSGNVLAASVVLATLEVVEKENICEKANNLQIKMRNYFDEIANTTGRLKNIRGIGGVIAADLIVDNDNTDQCAMVCQEAIQQGVLLRPLGKTIYWCPPLIIGDDALHKLSNITSNAIDSVFK